MHVTYATQQIDKCTEIIDYVLANEEMFGTVAYLDQFYSYRINNLMRDLKWEESNIAVNQVLTQYMPKWDGLCVFVCICVCCFVLFCFAFDFLFFCFLCLCF